MFVNNLFYWATNQSIIQRSLGGKNLAEGQKEMCIRDSLSVAQFLHWVQIVVCNKLLSDLDGIGVRQWAFLCIKVDWRLIKPSAGFRINSNCSSIRQCIAEMCIRDRLCIEHRV